MNGNKYQYVILALMCDALSYDVYNVVRLLIIYAMRLNYLEGVLSVYSFACIVARNSG